MHNTLVIYVFHEYSHRVECFVKCALFEHDDVDFLFVQNGTDFETNLPVSANVKYVVRENKGWDFGGWSHGLLVNNNIDKYKHFVFLNSSVLGPFTDETDWTNLFTSRLSDSVKLVGCTVNCMKDPLNSSHVQSYAFATDQQGARILFNEHIFFEDNGPVDHSDAVRNYEIRMSRVFINHGFNIECFLPTYKGVDFRFPQGLDTDRTYHDDVMKQRYMNTMWTLGDLVFVKGTRINTPLLPRPRTSNCELTTPAPPESEQKRSVVIFAIMEPGDDIVYTRQSFLIWERMFPSLTWNVHPMLFVLRTGDSDSVTHFSADPITLHNENVQVGSVGSVQEIIERTRGTLSDIALCTNTCVVFSSCRIYLRVEQTHKVFAMLDTCTKVALKDSQRSPEQHEDDVYGSLCAVYFRTVQCYLTCSSLAGESASTTLVSACRAMCETPTHNSDHGQDHIPDCETSGIHVEEVVTYPSVSTHPMQVCIYSVVTGGYEGTCVRNTKICNCDYFMLTDSFDYADLACHAGMYPLIILHMGRSAHLTQRHAKTLPHVYLPSAYKYSLYVDGHLQIMFTNIDTFIDDVNSQIENTSALLNVSIFDIDMLCYNHPARNRVMDEAIAVANLKLESPRNILIILSMMERDGVCHNYLKLTETNVLFRKHTTPKMVAFAREWSSCVEICRRDQISFDYLVQKHQLSSVQFPIQTKPVIQHKHVNPVNRKLAL